MTRRPLPSWRPWLPALVVGAAAGACAAAFFLVPEVALWIRTMGSVLGTGEVGSVRVFLGTWGRSSPLAVLLLAVWQALAVPLPHEAVVRGAAQVFGPLIGALASWAGLVTGSLAVFGLARALVGVPVRAARERRGPLPEPLGVDRRVLLGLRLVPFLPQDIVSLACGATRMRWRDFAAVTAVGVIPTTAFFTLFAERLPEGALTAYVAVSAAAGLGVLGWTAWRQRARIHLGRLPRESRRRLAVGAVLAGAAWAAYAFVPGFHLWVDTAVDVLGRGDIAFVRDYLLGFGVWAPVVSASLMVLQSVLAPLPAFVVTFANGLLFGWAWGALLSWSSAMAGAALCFWIARSLGRPVAEKLAGGSSALEVSDLFFERYGYRAVLIARLLPFVSFDIISYGAGLTSMGFWRFFVATGIGQLPATLVYSYLGQNLTGSVRVLFMVFLFTTAIFVAGSAFRPRFMARLRERSAGRPGPAAPEGR